MNIQLDDIRHDIAHSVKLALHEDIGSGDITAQLIPADQTNTANVITREDCTVCGQAWFDETFKQTGGISEITWHVKEGQRVTANTPLVTLTGNARSLLTGERTALNFLQLLSGIATKAHSYADALGDSHIKLLDTRKTIPGLRTAQKYAVTVGGCHNHRVGLFDAFLIKENHIAACGGITQAIQQAKYNEPNKKVEVEVETIDELKEAIAAHADIVMLDNFSPAQLQQAFELKNEITKYEMSGNMEIEDIAAARSLAIDYMSFGGLTKHCRAVDLSMRF